MKYFLKDLNQAMLFAVIIFGFCLRLWYINSPVSWDEAIIAAWITNWTLPELMTSYGNIGNHLFHSFLTFCSVQFFGDTLPVLRLPTLLSGTALIYFTYSVFQKRTNEAVALVAALLVAASSFGVYISVNARGYVVQTVMLLALIPLFERIALPGKKGYIATVSASLLLILAVYTLPTSVYVAPGLALWVLFKTIREQHYPVKVVIRNLSLVTLISFCGSLICYLPPLLATGGIEMINKGSSAMSAIPISTLLSHFPPVLTDFYALALQDLPREIFFLSLGLTGIGLIVAFFKFRKLFELLFFLTLSTFLVVLIFSRLTVPRVYTYFFPYICLLIAIGIVFMAELLQKRWIRLQHRAVWICSLFVLCVTITSGTILGDSIIYERSRHAGIRPFVEKYRKVLSPKTRILKNLPQVKYWARVLNEEYDKFHPLHKNDLPKITNGKISRIYALVRTRRENLQTIIQRDIQKRAFPISQYYEGPTLIDKFDDIEVYVWQLKTLAKNGPSVKTTL